MGRNEETANGAALFAGRKGPPPTPLPASNLERVTIVLLSATNQNLRFWENNWVHSTGQIGSNLETFGSSSFAWGSELASMLMGDKTRQTGNQDILRAVDAHADGVWKSTLLYHRGICKALFPFKIGNAIGCPSGITLVLIISDLLANQRRIPSAIPSNVSGSQFDC